MTEDSEPGTLPVWSVLEELMAQGIATFATQHLVGRGVAALLHLVLQLLGQRVRMYWVGEGWPWCVVFVLLRAEILTS